MAYNHDSSEDQTSDDEKTWLSDTSSPRSPDVYIGKLHPGTIIFLRKTQEIRYKDFMAAKIPQGCFNHPCVVLEVNHFRKVIIVCLITSFGGRLIEKSRLPPFKYDAYIPMHPTPDHAASKIQLTLCEGQMHRDGYVNTSQVFEVPLRMATLYHGSLDGHRLSRESFLVLLSQISGLESLWEISSAIVVTKDTQNPPEKTQSLEIEISKTVDAAEIESQKDSKANATNVLADSVPRSTESQVDPEENDEYDEDDEDEDDDEDCDDCDDYEDDGDDEDDSIPMSILRRAISVSDFGT